MAEQVPMEPSESKALTEESFKCQNCGQMFPTNQQREGKCPVCGFTCNRERCEVVQSSNQGY